MRIVQWSIISLNIPVPTDSPEMVLSSNSHIDTSHAQPTQSNTLRARTTTLGRAATMFAHKPLAPPPTVLQSLKAILLASCLCYVSITREFPSECAPRVKYPPTLYTCFSVYSTRSLCAHSDLFIEQWALHFALPSSNKKDTLVFVCGFPRVTFTPTYCELISCFHQFHSFLLYP